MKLPVIQSYGQYSSGNYGLNTLKVSLDTIVLYYSYDTIVAFSTSKSGLVVSKNEWGTTTGKHLNWINPNKRVRKDYHEFVQLLVEALRDLGKER